MKVEVMLWFVVLVSVAISIVSPRFRRFGFIIVGFAIVLIVLVIVLAKRSELAALPAPNPAVTTAAPKSKRVDFEQFHIEKLDKEDPGAKTRIALTEIRFDQLRFAAGSEPGTIEAINARLYNDSQRYTLTDYAFYLEVQDCVAATCTTVYDQRGRGAITVPANQARDVTISIRDTRIGEAPAFKLIGTAKLILTATETRAYLGAQPP